MGDSNERVRLGRREFIQSTAAATIGLGSGALSALDALAATPESSPTSTVKRYRTLGKTGLRMPDISMGTGSTANPDLIRYAYDRGITYFDTADGYPMGRRGFAEKAMAKALVGIRDKVVITTKTATKANTRRGELMKRLNASLKRLETDHIDIYLNHAVNDVDVLKNPEWFAFAERAKKQGKIRFTGMSGHSGNLIRCLDTAIDENLVDVILAAHNYGQDPAFYERFTKGFDIVANQVGLPRILEKAHAKGIGVIAMKTLMGARLNDMKPYEKPGQKYSHAAFRWVLSNPNVDGLIVSMKEREQVDEYLLASGDGAMRRGDVELLQRYTALNSADYCRPGCNACLTSCPDSVEIPEVLRARMYGRDYGDPDAARATYASIENDASACTTCSHESCAGSCPFGLNISALLRETSNTFGGA